MRLCGCVWAAGPSCKTIILILYSQIVSGYSSWRENRNRNDDDDGEVGETGMASVVGLHFFVFVFVLVLVD